jgi:SAM-dependent methyltransferase
MEEQRVDSEKLLSGFELFLKRNLKPGDQKGFLDWAETKGQEISRYPMELAPFYTDLQFREIFELLGEHYGFGVVVEDQKMIMLALLDSNVASGRTLSVGCGPAQYEIYLASQGIIKGEIVGVDTASSVLKEAKKIADVERVKNVNFVQEYGSDITFDNEFGQVLIIDSLHWMRKWRQCLERSAKALVPDGRLFLIYSIFAPTGKIDPMEAVKVLSEQGLNVGKLDVVDGYAGTPRAIISAKKQKPTGLWVPPGS